MNILISTKKLDLPSVSLYKIVNNGRGNPYFNEGMILVPGIFTADNMAECIKRFTEVTWKRWKMTIIRRILWCWGWYQSSARHETFHGICSLSHQGSTHIHTHTLKCTHTHQISCPLHSSLTHYLLLCLLCLSVSHRSTTPLKRLSILTLFI